MDSFSPVLKQADIFFEFSPTDLRAISAICAEQSFSLREMIVDENSPSDELYIIAQGAVEILVSPALVSDRRDIAMEPVVIATLHRGQSFGEIALVDRGLRSAAARAAEADTRLLVIQRQKLMALCECDLHIGFLLMRNLATDLALKIRSADLQIRESLL